MCTISVIVPCYNCERYINRCVDSLLSSSGFEREIILVNDGSTDKTGEICDLYAESFSNIKVIHQNNMGLVGAWKKGVLESSGDYILFCDSDDYIEWDKMELIEEILVNYNPDLVSFGMVIECEDGRIIYSDNMLSSGIYNKRDLENLVFPNFFSNGETQSEIMPLSRCSKCFSKELILKVIEYIPNSISFGEDDLTVFTAVLLTETLVCTEGVYPYHYVKNNTSMIGKYDSEVFNKIDFLFYNLGTLANKMGYSFEEQINQHRLSVILLFMKKEIDRYPQGVFKLRNRIKCLRNTHFVDAFSFERIKNYRLKEKLFSLLIFLRQYYLAIISVRLSQLRVSSGYRHGS